MSSSDTDKSPVVKIRNNYTPVLIDLTLSGSDEDEGEMSSGSTPSRSTGVEFANHGGPVIVDVRSETEWNTKKVMTPHQMDVTNRDPSPIDLTTAGTYRGESARAPGRDRVRLVGDDEDDILTESDEEKNDNQHEAITNNSDDNQNPIAIIENVDGHRDRGSTPPPLLVSWDADEPSTSAMTMMPTIFPISTRNNISLVDPLLGAVPSPQVFSPSPDRPEKRKKMFSTKGFTDEQIEILTASYEACPKLVPITFLDLSNQTGLPKSQIQTWFAQMNRKRRLSQTQTDIHSSPLGNNNVSHIPSQNSSPFENNFEQGNASTANSNPPHHQDGDEEVPPARRPAKDRPEETPEQTIKRIEERRKKILTFPPSKVREALEQSRGRSSTLLSFFVEENRGMKQKLMTETVRIKEKSPTQSVFTAAQNSCIAEWRTKFMQEKTAARSSNTVEALNSADLNILKIWIPLMVYGFLSGISLEETVRDFTFNSRNRAFATEDYIFPKYLSYHKRAVIKNQRH